MVQLTGSDVGYPRTLRFLHLRSVPQTGPYTSTGEYEGRRGEGRGGEGRGGEGKGGEGRAGERRGGERRGGEGKGGGAGSVIVTFARVDFHTTIHCVCHKLHFLHVIEQSAVSALTCVSVLVSCLFVPCCPPPPLPRLRSPTWWCMVQ